jgi:oxygen-independent coproporphyrinogen-3 oxidase
VCSSDLIDPTDIPLGLYIHFPWCVRKCPYCDFNSHEAPDDIPAQAYINALIDDLKQDAFALAGRTISTVFMGGGTPSLMPGREIARLLDTVRQHYNLSPTAEITLEANPGTVERQYFADYVAAGINRFSLGAQSFQPEQLKQLGRIHQPDDIWRAVELIQQLGVTRLNIDIMYGLPEQTPETAADDLKQALACNPGHLSWYQLTLEPNTVFYNHPPQLPADDTLGAIEAVGAELLGAQGYTQYEISAWCQPGQASQHNQIYWEFGDYIGIGAGAHGKLTTAEGSIRTTRTRMPQHYLQHIHGGRKYQAIQTQALPFEFMLNALRLREGVPESLWTARTGLPMSALEPQLSSLRQRGLMHPSQLALSAQGWWFYNDVVAAFLEASD